VPSTDSRVVTSSAIDTLDRTLRHFWELEEVPRVSTLLAEDKMYEDHYQNTHAKNGRGRYVLQLPFKKHIPSDNNSYFNALRRLNQVDAFLSKHSDISIQYKECMREYQDSNHMEKAVPHDEHQSVIYIPHHHIYRTTSTTTKLRVVFDGSSIMNSGLALNDYLLKGPKLQKDIISILMNFRFSRYVFSADIKQIFRQMLIHSKHRQYQCILWRDEQARPVIP